MYPFQQHYRSPSDPTQSPRQEHKAPTPRPVVLDWPPPSLEKPPSRLQRMMVPTRLLKKTTKETKEYVGFTPSGKGVKVTAGRVDEVYGSKGDVPQPTVTSQLFPHPDQKPLPQEPYEQMMAGMQDFEIAENDLEGVQHDDEGNPEYTPSARAKVLPWVTEMQMTPPPAHQTPQGSSAHYQTAASHHDPLSAAEYARADATGQVAEPGFVPAPPPGELRKRDTWIEEQSMERERLAREYEAENSLEKGDEDGEEGDSTEQQMSDQEEGKEKEKRDKRKHRHHGHKHGHRHRHHRHGGDKSKSKSRTAKLSKGMDDEPSDGNAPTGTKARTRTAHSAGMASDAMSRGAMSPGQGQDRPQAEFLGASGVVPGSEKAEQRNNVSRNVQDLHPPLPVGLGLGVTGVSWGQAGQSYPGEPHPTQTIGVLPGGGNPAGFLQGSASQYQQGLFHPPQDSTGNQGQEVFLTGIPLRGVNQPVTYPMSIPRPVFPGQNPIFESAPSVKPVYPQSDVDQTTQEQAIEAHLADLQQQMLRNAEESRQALAREKEQREREEARRHALNALGGGRSGKDSKSPASVRSGISRKMQPHANFPPEAKYVHTNAGNIKTYEEVRKMSSRHSTTDQSEASSKTASRETERERDAPKRKTKETFVTDTTGPSFGHFGRPFSHEILGGAIPGHEHRGFMEEEDIISPLGSGAPILVMRRVAHEDMSPVGLDLNALFGRTGPIRDHRSAYVETVDDEESPHVAASGTSDRPPTSLQSRHHVQVSMNRSGDRSRSGDSPQRKTKGSNDSNQGSAIFNETITPLPVESASVPQPRPQLRPPISVHQANRMSTATTTMSLVNQIVTDSRFHDDLLCDLLRAARDDSLGDAAKKALRRAARERVMDLTGMRQKYPGKADSEKTVTPAPRKRSDRSPSELDDEEPPAWSRALFEMLEHTNARLDALDSRISSDDQTRISGSLPAEDAEEEMAARAALHNLLFPDLPMDIPLFGSGPYATPPRSQFRADHAHISDLRTEDRTIGQLPDWGSSVEIPDGSSVPPALPGRVPTNAPLDPPITPTINIQPPTARASTAGGIKSQATHASPRSSPQGPTQDIRSIDNFSRRTTPSRIRDLKAPTSAKAESRAAPAKSETSPGQPEQDNGDPLLPSLPSPRPWDVVTQRLFSWALVWPPENFVRSLETTALGHQVDEFAVTIYMMTIFKRNLRHRMCSVPPLPCDKLFVPPNLADSINRAVHSKRFSDAKQILEELWYPFGLKEPPRVIVALAKHRNDANHWSAHRFDLPSGRLVTFSYSTEDKSLVDGRPFMWWFPIRDAWSTWNIPHPDHLAQKTQRVITPESSKEDNALMAANCARNLLLGWKPDQMIDLKKLRNNIWNETKRLYERKAKGKLVVDSRDY